jgi:hypothetical protein
MRRRRRRRRGCPWHNSWGSLHMSLRPRPLSSWNNGWRSIGYSTNLAYAPPVSGRFGCRRAGPRRLCFGNLRVWPTPRHHSRSPFRMNNSDAVIIVPVQLRRWCSLHILIGKDATRTWLQFVRHSRDPWVARHDANRILRRSRRMESRRRVDQSRLSPPPMPATWLPHPTRPVHKDPVTEAVWHPTPRIRRYPAVSDGRPRPVTVHEWIPARADSSRLPEIAVTGNVIVGSVIVEIVQAVLVGRLRVVAAIARSISAQGFIALLAPVIQLIGFGFFVQSVMRRIFWIETECFVFLHRNLVARSRIFYFYLSFEDHEFQRILDCAGNAEPPGVIKKNSLVAHCHRELVIMPARDVEFGLSPIKINGGESAA